MRRCLLLLACVTALSGSRSLTAQVATVQPPAAGDGIAAFLHEIEEGLRSGNPDGYLELLADDANLALADQFVSENIVAGATAAVVNEADRVPLPGSARGEGYRLMVELFTERGDSGQVATWRLDVRRTATADEPDGAWRIVDQERLTLVEGLYRLAVSTQKMYRVQNLTVSAEDLELVLPSGAAFPVETEAGPTGLILLGRGGLAFTPAPETERGQIEILTGDAALRTEFRAAYLRFNPEDFESRISSGSLFLEQTVRGGDLKRAQQVYERYAPESYILDLGALSRDRWWVIPNLGDFLADIETPRFDTVTYLKTGAEAEDIRVFDRKNNRVLSTYGSARKLEARGRYYSENDQVDYDVLDYDVDVAFTPDRQWLQGTGRLRIRAKNNLATITVRLADELSVLSVSSYPFGRLLPLRAPGQNSILLNFPTMVPKDFEFLVSVRYAGQLPPERANHQTVAPRDAPFLFGPMSSNLPAANPKPTFLYSNSAHWYPQSPVSDFGTASIRVTVPLDYACVASGDLADGSPEVVEAGEDGQRGRRYAFNASQPLRYLAMAVSKFESLDGVEIAPSQDGPAGPPDRRDAPPGVYYDAMAVSVESNLRQSHVSREMLPKASRILEFYGSVMGDLPYQHLTLTLAESTLPGGHSPAYFALVNTPPDAGPVLWRNDPVHFSGFEDFFLAHELAHQWWGQAIGWSNYHEQWLSEGIAQYFAALYAEHELGPSGFNGLLRDMGQWALKHSSQGPIWLGYRVGHIKGEEEVFRSIVYNKSAMVLHMLRRLVGDESFFRALRRFYLDHRFSKASTERFRESFEAETGRPLARFFERWVYDTELPQIAFQYRVEPPDASAAGGFITLRFQQPEPVFDVPVTVTLNYSSGSSEQVLVVVDDTLTEVRVPLGGPLRGVDLNRDSGALADFRQD